VRQARGARKEKEERRGDGAQKVRREKKEGGEKGEGCLGGVVWFPFLLRGDRHGNEK